MSCLTARSWSDSAPEAFCTSGRVSGACFWLGTLHRLQKGQRRPTGTGLANSKLGPVLSVYPAVQLKKIIVESVHLFDVSHCRGGDMGGVRRLKFCMPGHHQFPGEGAHPLIQIHQQNKIMLKKSRLFLSYAGSQAWSFAYFYQGEARSGNLGFPGHRLMGHDPAERSAILYAAVRPRNPLSLDQGDPGTRIPVDSLSRFRHRATSPSSLRTLPRL